VFTTLSTSGSELNLEYVKGVTLGPISYVLRTRDGLPVDLTSATIRAWVQKGLMGDKVVDMQVEKTDVNRFSISLSAAETFGLPPMPLSWGVVIAWPSGQMDSPIYGGLNPVRVVPP
jgi:hypothetical protein